MRALNVLLALLFPVVLFLALFEGGLRLLGKGPVESGLRFDEVAVDSRDNIVAAGTFGNSVSATCTLGNHKRLGRISPIWCSHL